MRNAKRINVAKFCFSLSLLAMSIGVEAASTVITNTNVFDGENKNLQKGVSVLVEENKITSIGKKVSVPEDATVIDAKGKTLIPGLIDAHWHTMFANASMSELMNSDFGYLTLIASDGANKTLMRGFTTIRDAGGNPFAIKQASDKGLINGPRIYPSGGPISQTAGHFDYRGRYDVPANSTDPLNYLERNSLAIVADGVPEVTKRVREQLRLGATQIKLAAGGGVSSSYDPIDVAEYTYEEFKAAVDVAESWNTYVMVHVFTNKGAQTALRAGVKSIEHGNLLSEETFKMMAEKGAWLSMQPIFDDEDAIPFPPGSFQEAKFKLVTKGTARGIELAKKYGVPIAFGTDMLFDPSLANKQGKFLTKLTPWFEPWEILKMATHDNAQLLKLSGPRNPYPGELGVIKEGALADLVLVDGNPLEDINLVENSDKNFVLIMKDGKIYKNSLSKH